MTPSELQRVVTPSGEVAVLDEGTGSPVLLVHGYCGSRADWDRVVPGLLDRGHRVVRVDLPGHGASPLERHVMTGGDVAAVIGGVLDELDLRDAVVAGHSLGGIGALRFAVDQGPAIRARVGGLILVSTSADPWRLPEVSTVAMGSHPLAVPALAVPAVGRAALRATCFAPGARRSDVEHVRKVWRGTGYRTRWAYAAGAASEVALRSKLGRVAVPTVAVTGTADTRTPPGRAEQLARGIPGARAELVEGAGHAILVERPGAVVDAILTLVPAAAAGGSSGRRARRAS